MDESPDDRGPMGSDAETKKENDFVSAVLQMVLRTVKDQLIDLQKTDDAHGGTLNKNTTERIQLMHVAVHVCQALLHLQSVSAEPMCGSALTKI